MTYPVAAHTLASIDDVFLARDLTKAATRALGCRDFVATRIVTCVLELARNALEHGGGGSLRMSLTERDAQVTLKLVVSDQGPGLGRATSGGGLGLGLAGVQRMATRFVVDTGAAGTRVTADFQLPASTEALAQQAARARAACDQLIDEAGAGERRVQELEDELRDRDLLIDEVHHRTANNLAMVTAMIRAERRRAQADETHGVLAALLVKIDALARAHKLLQTRGEDAVDMGVYLAEVSASAKHFDRPGLAVEIVQAVAPGTVLEPRLALDLGLVTGELITNAYKHAFRGRDRGRIVLTLAVQDHELVYRFQDDGVGLPADQRPERSGSLGWKMIRSTVQRHAGHLEVDGHEGLSVTLRFASAR